MKPRKKKHAPRPRAARTLLAVAGGAALVTSVAVSAIGCGDDTVVGNPFPDLSAQPADMAHPLPISDIGNPGRFD